MGFSLILMCCWKGSTTQKCQCSPQIMLLFNVPSAYVHCDFPKMFYQLQKLTFKTYSVNLVENYFICTHAPPLPESETF